MGLTMKKRHSIASMLTYDSISPAFIRKVTLTFQNPMNYFAIKLLLIMGLA